MEVYKYKFPNKSYCAAGSYSARNLFKQRLPKPELVGLLLPDTTKPDGSAEKRSS